MLVTGFVGKVRLFLYVDNDLAFFSVKTDSSMDIYHLIRYTVEVK